MKTLGIGLLVLTSVCAHARDTVQDPNCPGISCRAPTQNTCPQNYLPARALNHSSIGADDNRCIQFQIPGSGIPSIPLAFTVRRDGTPSVERIMREERLPRPCAQEVARVVDQFGWCDRSMTPTCWGSVDPGGLTPSCGHLVLTSRLRAVGITTFVFSCRERRGVPVHTIPLQIPKRTATGTVRSAEAHPVACDAMVNGVRQTIDTHGICLPLATSAVACVNDKVFSDEEIDALSVIAEQMDRSPQFAGQNGQAPRPPAQQQGRTRN